MITFKFLRFPFVVCIPHTVNELVTDIILNNTGQEDLMLTLLYIGSRLFELFSKEVHVKKQPGRPLIDIHRTKVCQWYILCISTCICIRL